jgi:hypothetical protein
VIANDPSPGVVAGDVFAAFQPVTVASTLRICSSWRSVPVPAQLPSRRAAGRVRHSVPGAYQTGDSRRRALSRRRRREASAAAVHTIRCRASATRRQPIANTFAGAWKYCSLRPRRCSRCSLGAPSLGHKNRRGRPVSPATSQPSADVVRVDDERSSGVAAADEDREQDGNEKGRTLRSAPRATLNVRYAQRYPCFAIGSERMRSPFAG